MTILFLSFEFLLNIIKANNFWMFKVNIFVNDLLFQTIGIHLNLFFFSLLEWSNLENFGLILSVVNKSTQGSILKENSGHNFNLPLVSLVKDAWWDQWSMPKEYAGRDPNLPLVCLLVNDPWVNGFTSKEYTGHCCNLPLVCLLRDDPWVNGFTSKEYTGHCCNLPLVCLLRDDPWFQGFTSKEYTGRDPNLPLICLVRVPKVINICEYFTQHLQNIETNINLIDGQVRQIYQYL